MTEFREWPKEELLEGFQAGRTLIVQRKDDPNLPFLRQLEREGKVTSELVQIDEQTSKLKFRWTA